MMETLTRLTVTIDVPLERAINCIIGGIEGGYSPWLHAFTPAATEQTENAIMRAAKEPCRIIWYANEAFWENGGAAVMAYDLDTEREGEGNGRATITLSSLRSAFANMALVAPRHFADLIGENDDAITHDVFMQMLVFDEIVYG